MLKKFELNNLTNDFSFMSRALELAKNGLGTTYPNPMVGCVIVHDQKIIGEGYTSAYGGAHAEVNAIASVVDKGLLKSATVYVTLEPCAHHGKTPPCVDLIIAHKVPKVVVGLLDPNPLVSGKGIAKLKQAECNVSINVLAAECREHHKRFLTFQEKKRPYVILKWAETLDGFIAPTNEKRNKEPEAYWITNANSRQLVHKWRTEEQAILVGTNTVLADNPKLNARDYVGKNPFRVVIDRQLRIPKNYNVLDRSTPTLILTEITDASHFIDGITYEYIDFSNDIIPQILSVLYRYKIISVLVEGGTQTLQSFINAKFWDEARIFQGKTSFHEGLKAPFFYSKSKHQIKINTDILSYYRNA